MKCRSLGRRLQVCWQAISSLFGNNRGAQQIAEAQSERIFPVHHRPTCTDFSNDHANHRDYQDSANAKPALLEKLAAFNFTIPISFQTQDQEDDTGDNIQEQ